MKRYSIFLATFCATLHAIPAAEYLNTAILLSQTDAFLKKLEDKTSKLAVKPSTGSLLGDIQKGNFGLKPTPGKTDKPQEKPQDAPGSFNTEMINKGIEAKPTVQEDTDDFEDDPLVGIENDILTYEKLLKSPKDIQTWSLDGQVTHLKLLKAKLEKGNFDVKRTSAFARRIDNLIAVYSFLLDMANAIKNPNLEAAVTSLHGAIKKSVDMKGFGFTQIPPKMKEDLQKKLDDIQGKVTDALTVQNSNDIRLAFGVSSYKPLVPQKPVIPQKPAPSTTTIPAGIAVPRPVAAGNAGDVFGSIQKGVSLKPVSSSSAITGIDFSKKPEASARALNAFKESDFSQLTTKQLIDIIKNKEDIISLLDADTQESLEEAIAAKARDSQIDPRDRIQLNRWQIG